MTELWEPENAGDHSVPADLLELYEVLEWQGKIEVPELKKPAPKLVRAFRSTGTAYVSRAEWGARAPRSRPTNFWPQRGGNAGHYEGPPMGDFPHSSCATKWRGIQSFHMNDRGWSDIAYNFGYCPHGYWYELRGLGVRSSANGTNDGNDRFYAICGLFGQGDPFTDAAKAAARRAIDHTRNHGNAGPAVVPHSAFKATACPGDPKRNWIKAGYPDPTPNIPPVHQEDDDVLDQIKSDQTGKTIYLTDWTRAWPVVGGTPRLEFLIRRGRVTPGTTSVDHAELKTYLDRAKGL